MLANHFDFEIYKVKRSLPWNSLSNITLNSNGSQCNFVEWRPFEWYRSMYYISRTAVRRGAKETNRLTLLVQVTGRRKLSEQLALGNRIPGQSDTIELLQIHMIPDENHTMNHICYFFFFLKESSFKIPYVVNQFHMHIANIVFSFSLILFGAKRVLLRLLENFKNNVLVILLKHCLS